MASEKINIVVALKDKASKSVGKIGKAFNKLKKNAKLVAVAGIGALASMIVKTTKLFGVQEKAITQMEAALKATGQEVKNNSQDLQDYASELQKVTTVGDEASLQVMQMGLNMGLSATQTKQATKDAIGLSKAYGVDMKTAMKAVAAAQKGDYNMLNRCIPSLRSFKDETEKATEAKRLLSAAFQVAKSETQTLAGATIQMQSAIGDAGEEIGKVFAPMLQKAAKFIRGLAERFSNLSPNAKRLTVIIGTITVALMALIPLLAVIATSISAISWPLIAVVGGLTLATVGFVELKGAVESAGGVVGFLKNSFIAMGQVVLGQIKKIMTMFNNFLKVLSKIPGIDLNVDDAIEAMDRLDERMEEKKEKDLADKEEQKVLEEEEAAVKEEQEAMAAEKEEEARQLKKQKLEEDFEQEKQLNRQKQSDMVTGFKEWLGIEKLKVATKANTAKKMETWENFMVNAQRSKSKEVAGIAKALAKKDIAIKSAQAAMSAFSAMSGIPIVGPMLGGVAAAAALAFGAEQIAAVDSQGTALAEGGIVAATPGGIQATIGEGGQDEAVVPLPDEGDEGESRLGGDILVNVNIDGKPLVKEFYEIEQEMIRTGEIDTGGS